MNGKAHRHSSALLAASLIGSAVFCASQPVARAALLAYEPFNYTAGTHSGSSIPTANDLGGDTGFAANSAWSITHPATIGEPGLTYTRGGTLQTSGNYLSGLAYNTTGVNNVQIYRNLSTTYGLTGSAATPVSVWGSVIMQADAVANSGQYGQLRLMGTTNGTFIGIGYSNGGSAWSIQGYDGVSSYPSANSTVSVTTQSLLVFQIVLGGGTDSSHYKVNLWVNPTLDAEGSLPAANAVLSSSLLANFQFNALKVMVASNSSGVADPLSVDEIRLGTTVTDVLPIPEPASIGVLSGLTLLCIRCRPARS